MIRNTARTFFANPKIVAKILDVPEELIKGIANIWMTLKSGHMINPVDFGKQCDEWVELYKASKISWYKMSPSSIDCRDNISIVHCLAPVFLGSSI